MPGSASHPDPSTEYLNALAEEWADESFSRHSRPAPLLAQAPRGLVREPFTPLDGVALETRAACESRFLAIPDGSGGSDSAGSVEVLAGPALMRKQAGQP